MRRTIFCNHYRSMADHSTCEAGVAYETLKGIEFDKRPCFCRNGGEPNGGCEFAAFPTAEQLAQEEADMNRRFECTMKARRAIVEHLGGPWKRGMEGSQGRIDCPVCGGTSSLRFSRAGYNGHIHASCSTEGCVSWME